MIAFSEQRGELRGNRAKRDFPVSSEGFGRLFRKFPKRFTFICVAALILVCAVLYAAFTRQSPPDESVYTMAYTVRPNAAEGSLSVALRLDIKRLADDHCLSLYKGKMMALLGACTDENGAAVSIQESEDLVILGPIDAAEKTVVTLSYDARVGVVSDAAYVQGCVFDDLVSFSGEYALMTPYLDPAGLDRVGDVIPGLSFEMVLPAAWQSVMPYQPPLSTVHSFTVDRPDWACLNAISKSAFSFGQFERFQPAGAFAQDGVYVDKGLAGAVPSDTVAALDTFLQYDAALFGAPLSGDVPIVLLRNHPETDAMIAGGVGSRGSAVSAGLRVAEDFRALSNLVFHSYFDSKVQPRNLRYVTNNWLYRGLSEYYVGLSAERLPAALRATWGIGDRPPEAERYLKYLYFSLKEPGFLALRPTDEGAMYVAQEEFYMSVKVPLLIDAIHYAVENKSGRPDGLIRGLAEAGGSSKPLDTAAFLYDLCGAEDYAAIERYIAGTALIPNFRGLSAADLPDETVLSLLDDEEEKYAYYFDAEQAFYPYTPLLLLDAAAFSEAAAERGVHYSTDEIEAAVSRFSEPLHRLLLQYAARLSLAGVDDRTRPESRRALFEPEAVAQWEAFCEEIGIDEPGEGAAA